MSKEFRRCKIDDAQFLPPSVQNYLPKDHLSREKTMGKLSLPPLDARLT
jgi:hypothetical protein